MSAIDIAEIVANGTLLLEITKVRPTFNVTDFQDVINVQMNDPMRHLLINFIDEVEGDELEIELRALRNALSDPQGALERKLNGKAGSRHRRQRNQQV